jgi:hypothetical protein
MKLNKRVIAPALLALTLTASGITSTVVAQPRTRAAKAKKTQLITPMMLEKVIGKPLTAEQKTAIADAAKTYQESVAKAVGLTPEELALQTKEYRKAQRTKKAAQ